MTPLSGRGAVAGSTGTVLLSTATLPRPFTVPLPVPLVLNSGPMAVVRRQNELPAPAVAHLHGNKTPPQDDGYPGDPHIAESIDNIGAVKRSPSRGGAQCLPAEAARTGVRRNPP